MERYQNTVQDKYGNAIENAQVRVYDHPSGAQASVYDDSDTLIVQPFASDPNGTFAFKAANGKYKIKATNGATDYWFGPVTLFDIADGDLEWTLEDTTITAYTASSVTMPGDRSDVYDSNRAIKAEDTTNGTIYGYVSSSSYASGPNETTIIIDWTGDTLTAIPTSLHYGLNHGANISTPRVSIGSYEELDLSGGNITLTSAQTLFGRFKCTGAITADTTITVPNVKRGSLVFDRQTTGAYKVTVKTSAGSGVELPDLREREVYCTGVDVLSVEPPLPRKFIDGLELSLATDVDHDITVALGLCRDSSDTYNFELIATITKQIDASHAAGDNAGGLFSGTVAANTWYHVFLIRKDSDGSIDAGFDTSVSAANIPTGYTAYRRIGSVLTDSSANIISFHQDGDTFMWDVAVGDVSVNNPGSAASTRTLSVPVGLPVGALIVAGTKNEASTTSAHYGLITSLEQSDITPSANSYDWYCRYTYTWNGGHKQVRTNVSGQVRSRLSNSSTSVNLWISTHGWIDPRI